MVDKVSKDGFYDYIGRIIWRALGQCARFGHSRHMDCMGLSQFLEFEIEAHR